MDPVHMVTSAFLTALPSLLIDVGVVVGGLITIFMVMAGALYIQGLISGAVDRSNAQSIPMVGGYYSNSQDLTIYAHDDVLDSGPEIDEDDSVEDYEPDRGHRGSERNLYTG